jgi:DNA-binding response OmpR family regulator
MTTQASRILIIDDEPYTVRLIMDILRDCGFDLLSSTNGAEGVILAQARLPDLILLDIVMRGMNGFEVCRELKANTLTREIPVIFLSALADTEKKLRGFNVGGMDYITKPFDPREVLARITTHLHTHSLLEEMRQRLGQYEGKNTDHIPVNATLELVYQARDKLLTQLQNPPSLDELARTLGTNRTKLAQAFRARLGLSVFAYLRRQRLIRASHLLRETQFTIKQIAAQVGYRNSRDFSVAFKTYFSVTPSEYRHSPPFNNG